MSGTTAVPPTFRLQVRLIDSRKLPFEADHQFRVTWGKDTISGTTDANGMVDVPLDGDPAIKCGLLELGPLKGKPFKTALAIRIVKHGSREVSADIAGRGQPPRMWHDIAWRLSNLGYYPDDPSNRDPGPYPSPSRVQHMWDAMLLFKACNHQTLRLVDWLDPKTSASDRRLTGDQDDAAVTQLLFQHDHLPSEAAAADKLANAKKGKDPL